MESPQTWNRFGYVLNNPIRFNDPTGHVCTDPEHPNPTCYGSPLVQTKVGNKMIRGNGAELKTSNLHTPGTTGNRGSTSSGVEGELNKDNPPNHPDPTLSIPPLDGVCPEQYSLVQCAYRGNFYKPMDDINFDMDNYGDFSELLLAIFFDIKHRAPVGGYDFNQRSVYDTPLWDGYGAYTGKVCFSNECYKRSEVNYVAQGMWSAAANQSNAEGRLGVLAWKLLSFISKPTTYFPPMPSDGTLIWFDRGQSIFNTLNNSYPYASP